jgi:hypothetical protein
MKRQAIWIDGSVLMKEVAQIFRDAGWHLHCKNGLMVADPVPSMVRKDPPNTNVLPLPKRRTANSKGSA